VTILETLLPEGMSGGISTVPLSYKAWMAAAAEDEWDRIAANVAHVVARLVRVRLDRGRTIHLDIEPEPDCVLETAEETCRYFDRHLRTTGAKALARLIDVPEDEARHAIDTHVQVCFDCCHCAVEYEDPLDALRRLTGAGIRIGRVQLSSALRVVFPSDPGEAAAVARRLEAFAESTYLHQVVERREDRLRRFPDLADALGASPSPSGAEWRIHFHVPLFASDYDGLGSTQDVVRSVVTEARRTGLTEHFEIETYTWSVLPDGLKLPIAESIAREFEWVLGVWSGRTVDSLRVGAVAR
jgi:hypothetical protein